jgi:hypothetical protein
MVDQYANAVQALAPSSLIKAATELSAGLKNPLISNGEFTALMRRFCDELSAITGQTHAE